MHFTMYEAFHESLEAISLSQRSIIDKYAIQAMCVGFKIALARFKSVIGLRIARSWSRECMNWGTNRRETIKFS